MLGQAFLPWLADVAEIMLEVDADGRWCRRTWLLIAPRQSAKSTFLRSLASWLAAVDGQIVLTCSAKLQSTQHLMRPEQLRIRGVDGAHVKYAKEQPEANYPGWTEDERRWIGQAANSAFGRGFTADTLLIDEVQDVGPEALESASPTLTERPNPLTIMVGTGTREDSSPLLQEQRQIALTGGPVALIEWSAPPGSDWRDEESWRLASPRWNANRLRRIRDDIAKGETFVRTEYLCQQMRAKGMGEPWLDLAAWERARRSLEIPERVQVAAVEDGRGGLGGSVALAWSEGATVCVTAWSTPTLVEAWHEAARAERVVCGITLRNEEQARELGAHLAGRRETATALPELRRLLAADGLAWNGQDLDDQLRRAIVREDSVGALSVMPTTPTGAMRTAAWAVQSVRVRREPVLV